MKRPMLVSGTAISVVCFVLVHFGSKAAPFILLSAASVFIVYLLKFRDKIIIPAICIAAILGTSAFLLFNHFSISPYTHLDGTRADITGKVISIPRQEGKQTTFTLKTLTINGESASTKIKVSIPGDKAEELEIFQCISAENTLISLPRDEINKLDTAALSDGILLEGTANSVKFLWSAAKTPYFYCLRLRENTINQIDSYLSGDYAALLCGMLFGYTDNISDATLSLFRTGGIAHLLAVSGLHTATWCAYIQNLLKLLRRKERTSSVLCLLFLGCFCIVSAFTPSVLRASIMMSVILLGTFFRRSADTLNSLGLAVSLLLLFNPYTITSPGFLLSVSATAGVIFSGNTKDLYSRLLKKIPSIRIRYYLHRLMSNLTVSLCAGIFTLPASAYFFGVYSVIAPVTNILCVALAFKGMLLGLVTTTLSFIPLSFVNTLCIILFKVYKLIIFIILNITEFLCSFTYASLPVKYHIFEKALFIALVIVLIGYMIYKRKQKSVIAVTSVLLCLATILTGIISPMTDSFNKEIIVENVGNGGNIIVKSHNEYAVLNLGTSDFGIQSKNLPLASCEKLKYFFITSSTDYNDTDKTSDYIIKRYSPESTIITDYASSLIKSADFTLPDNTSIADKRIFPLGKEITIQIVDTYPINCVIIRNGERLTIITYGTESDFSDIFKKYGVPDTLIITNNIPQAIPCRVEKIIISSNSENMTNPDLPGLTLMCDKLLTTYEEGCIRWRE